MKQLVILSGKGGTGKTTVTAALADIASRESALVIVDADVDASNLELLLSPTRVEQDDFIGGQVASIDEDLCAGCGTCESVCRFDAVRFPSESTFSYQIDRTVCEGCAACLYACPTEAIRMEPQRSGIWFRSRTRFGELFHAHLFAGQESSGKLITLLKEKARALAQADERSLVLVDGPPGIGCPVIASLSGADLMLVVTEPTISAVHDLQRILGTARHFSVSPLVAINKTDINPSLASTIEEVCRAQAVEVVGRIPYDDVFTQAMVEGLPVTSFHRGALVEVLESIWRETKGHLQEPKALEV